MQWKVEDAVSDDGWCDGSSCSARLNDVAGRGGFRKAVRTTVQKLKERHV